MTTYEYQHLSTTDDNITSSNTTEEVKQQQVPTTFSDENCIDRIPPELSNVICHRVYNCDGNFVGFYIPDFGKVYELITDEYIMYSISSYFKEKKSRESRKLDFTREQVDKFMDNAPSWRVFERFRRLGVVHINGNYLVWNLSGIMNDIEKACERRDDDLWWYYGPTYGWHRCYAAEHRMLSSLFPTIAKIHKSNYQEYQLLTNNISHLTDKMYDVYKREFNRYEITHGITIPCDYKTKNYYITDKYLIQHLLDTQIQIGKLHSEKDLIVKKIEDLEKKIDDVYYKRTFWERL